MPARTLIVWGTSSGAGKSWLVTALCRYYARRGLRVAPFKAQNMSNNARVVATADGGAGEIGAAQYFQALAAGVAPEVAMNPLLLKPEADTRSQVVLMGRVEPTLSRLPWRERSEHVWPAVAQALDHLRTQHELVIIEGAGSPAEINLQASDIVNLRVARHADAHALLVTDIDRGGAFAHLLGTWTLLPADLQARLRGFVLNKFRGDPALLDPAPQQLQRLTGVPVVATIPWQRHGLPEEDGVFDDRPTGDAQATTTVAVIAYPRASNLDEWQPLRQVRAVRLVWARSPADCAGADWLVLPGSKATAADLAWLRARGLDRVVVEHAQRGGRVLGVCGGLQMLGEALIDPHGIDGNAPGLGLLPLVTTFAREKTVRPRRLRLGPCRGAWQALSGLAVCGYEIHHGQTAVHPGLRAAGATVHEVLPGLAWQNEAGHVFGLYLHGLLENPAVLQALFGARAPALEAVFDALADSVQRHFYPGVLDALIAR
jgi:adenosylcobyric acid synthase